MSFRDKADRGKLGDFQMGGGGGGAKEAHSTKF